MDFLKNKWVIGGIIAAIGGFGYLYIKNKNAAATAAAQPTVITAPSQDASTAGNEPGTGFNAGNYPGYNGLGAGGTTIQGLGPTITNENPGGTVQGLQTATTAPAPPVNQGNYLAVNAVVPSGPGPGPNGQRRVVL